MIQKRKIDWKYWPSPPEMLQAQVEGGPNYLYKCVGNVPARDDEEGDIVRVWVPDQATPYNEDVIEELEEKHGRYAGSKVKARELDGFTEV